MKFPIEEGIGEVRGNQLMAKECYFATVKGKPMVKETFTVSSDNLAKQKQNKVEVTKGVRVDKQGKITKVRTQMA